MKRGFLLATALTALFLGACTGRPNLNVRVVNYDTGKPIATATISLGKTTKKVDSNGAARFDDLASTRNVVTLRSTGFPEYRRVITASSARRMIIKLRRATLDGSVVNIAKYPIPGARVRVGQRTALTGTDGRYRLRDLPIGPAVVHISAEKFPSQTIKTTLQSGVRTLDVSLLRQAKTMHVDRRTEPRIAYLTIDDGPDPLYTQKVLRILAKYDVQATFFLVGRKIEAHPELALWEQDEGHTIGNHTYSHNYGNLYGRGGAKAFLADVRRNDKVLYDVLGIHTLMLRPPGGAVGNFSTGYYNAVASSGYRMKLWDVSTGDGSPSTTADQMLRNTIRQVSAGGFKSRPIILMHDSGPAIVEALPKIIEYLSSQGYKFDTLE